MVDSEINWYSKTVSETLLELDTSSEGLSSQEAEARLRLNGPNSLAHDEKNKTLKLLFRNFNSILIYILLVSAIISLLSSHMIELIVILIIIFFTGIFGFIQEYHAGKALNALSKIAVKNVEIMRDGKKVEIDKEEIVIGDIVLLKRGMIVPADIRIMESKGLSADESILTGESVQKYKRSEEINQEDILISDQEDILFAGTSITNGTGLGVVVATGLESEIGKISLRLKKIGFQKSPIQNQIDVNDYTILFSEREFKKTRVQYFEEDEFSLKQSVPQ